MHAIREVMLVRYRELYGTTLGNPRSVVRADLGRGVVMHFWRLPPDRRLPLRAYVAGYTLKNGVPINYIEAIGLCEWIEVGFNTFYTYRQGETAWIYAQALRCLRALTGATMHLDLSLPDRPEQRRGHRLRRLLVLPQAGLPPGPRRSAEIV